MRDGFSFSLRHVVAEQSGVVILTLNASFTTQRSGLAHQDAMPAAPAPDSLDDWEDLRVRVLGPDTVRRPDGPLEVRDCEPAERGARHRASRAAAAVDAPARSAARTIRWCTRRCSSTPATAGSSARRAGRTGSCGASVSVRASTTRCGSTTPPRFDDWVLYDMTSPVASAGRGLCHGAMYRARRDPDRVGDAGGVDPRAAAAHARLRSSSRSSGSSPARPSCRDRPRPRRSPSRRRAGCA